MFINFKKSQVNLVFLLAAVMFLVLTGCETTTEDVLATHTSHSKTSQPSPQFRQANIDEGGQSDVPTVLPTQTVISSPTMINTPTRYFTQMPDVTLSPSQADSRFLGWLKGSQECRFPCWAGIVPGQSTWQEAKLVIGSVVDITGLLEKSKCTFGNCNMLDWNNTVRPNTFGYVYSKADNVVYGIYLQNIGSSIPEYDINEILTNYGLPKQIYISTTDFFNEEPLPFELIMVYPQEKFIIRYFRNAWIEGDDIVNCGGTHQVTLTIGFDDGRDWDPQRVMEITYLGDDLEGVFLADLDAVTEYTIESFYEAFIKDSDTCISTPRELWP